MKSDLAHTAIAADGTRVAYWESGRPNGYPVVFLHGFGLDHGCWERLWTTRELRSTCRLIALDLRGHGESGRPANATGYDDHSVAGDLASVIDDAGLDAPVVVAWSYGARTLNDFMLHHGSDRVGGINYVAAASLADPGPARVASGSLAAMCSDDPHTEHAAIDTFLRQGLGLAGAFADSARLTVAQTTARERGWMRARRPDYDALLSWLDVPVLVSHGLRDALVAPDLSQRLAAHLKDARLSLYEEAGHAPFWDAPDRFTRELLELVSEVRFHAHR